MREFLAQRISRPSVTGEELSGKKEQMKRGQGEDYSLIVSMVNKDVDEDTVKNEKKNMQRGI